MSKAASVNSGQFASEVEGSEDAVVVDFWAEWCPPCKMLGPVFDKVAQKFEGRVKFVKVDVDQNQDVAMKYGVTTIPNLMFFKGGQVVDQSIGYVNEAQLSAKIDQSLLS